MVIEPLNNDFELDAFLRALVHDLRNTLQGMQMTLKVLEAQPGMSEIPKASVYMERLQRAKEEADRLLASASSFRRIQFGDLSYEEVDLRDVIDSSLPEDLLRERDSITLEGLEVSLMSDRNLLLVIFSNLIRNALQYNRNEQRRVGIKAAMNGRLKVWVIDNGIGLSAGSFDQVFEPSRRLTSEHGEGIGMGLFLAKKAAERLGGSVWIDSSTETGSRFVVEFPVESLK